MICFIDIETIKSTRTDLTEHFNKTIKPPGNIKKKESIDAWWKDKSGIAVKESLDKTSLSGDFGEIISISYALNDGAVNNVFRYQGESESIFLNGFAMGLSKDLGQRKIDQWVGHNVAAFDLPFIYKRCIINGVTLPDGLPVNPNPWDKKVFDTMFEWAGRGNRISQDNLCFILGIEQKPSDISGANVGQHYIDGNFEKIINYNNYDVETIRRIYNRMNFNNEVVPAIDVAES